jgi:uncharacterized protein (TIGR04168 family)
MQLSLPANQDAIRLGVIGDLHTHFDDVDLAHFAGSDYDLLYFTGDLGGGTLDSSLRIARSIARLSRPTLVMPGNNDTVDIDELAAELAHRQGLQQLLSIARDDPRGNTVSLCGYSLHRLTAGAVDVSLIAARPHSMGGPNLSFPDYMRESYSIGSLEDSSRRLMALVDRAETEQLIFLAHNGPKGLGEAAHDIWGCDFKDNGGDWGDPDLAMAIDHARDSGRQVTAVIAGHMHLRTKQGAERPWILEKDNTTYINAARVPRIFSGREDVYRHHVAVTIRAGGIEAEEVLVPQYG